MIIYYNFFLPILEKYKYFPILPAVIPYRVCMHDHACMRATGPGVSHGTGATGQWMSYATGAIGPRMSHGTGATGPGVSHVTQHIRTLVNNVVAICPATYYGSMRISSRFLFFQQNFVWFLSSSFGLYRIEVCPMQWCMPQGSGLAVALFLPLTSWISSKLKFPIFLVAGPECARWCGVHSGVILWSSVHVLSMR